MKFLCLLAIAVCVVASIQASPQGVLAPFTTLSSTVSSLFGQVTTMVKNVATATGKPLQPLLLAGLALPANLLPTLLTLPSATMNVVNGLLTNGLSQITTVVVRAGTDLNRLVPAIRDVQTILTSTVNNLNALNVPATGTLTSTLTALSNTLGGVVFQIYG